MRKTILFLAVLLMTVPAMAVSNVDITCSRDGNEITVSYASDENRIRAFGLDITVEGANITKVIPVDANYRIFPGQIVIVDGEVTDYNTPYAPGDLGDANVTIEMGSLYTLDPNYASDANAGYGMQPGLSGDLLKFYVDGACDYDVNENPVIGGIVMEDPDEEPNVTLCSGGVCHVPDVVGEPNAVAQAAIIAAGLTIGTITTECNDTIADGNVISTDPAYCNYPDCGTAVDIVVSTGPCCVCGAGYDNDDDGDIDLDDYDALKGKLNWAGFVNNGVYYIAPGDPNTGFLWDSCFDTDDDVDIDLDDYDALKGKLNWAGFVNDGVYYIAPGDPNTGFLWPCP